MTHEELLAKINYNLDKEVWLYNMSEALRAVVELHKPIGTACSVCKIEPDDDHDYSSRAAYPCLTIQAIEKELKNG